MNVQPTPADWRILSAGLLVFLSLSLGVGLFAFLSLTTHDRCVSRYLDQAPARIAELCGRRG